MTIQQVRQKQAILMAVRDNQNVTVEEIRGVFYFVPDVDNMIIELYADGHITLLIVSGAAICSITEDGQTHIETLKNTQEF